MKDVELRWVGTTLQYRVFKDHGGPYPNYYWSDWITVPTAIEVKNNVDKTDQ